MHFIQNIHSQLFFYGGVSESLVCPLLDGAPSESYRHLQEMYEKSIRRGASNGLNWTLGEVFRYACTHSGWRNTYSGFVYIFHSRHSLPYTLPTHRDCRGGRNLFNALHINATYNLDGLGDVLADDSLLDSIGALESINISHYSIINNDAVGVLADFLTGSLIDFNAYRREVCWRLHCAVSKVEHALSLSSSSSGGPIPMRRRASGSLAYSTSTMACRSIRTSRPCSHLSSPMRAAFSEPSASWRAIW